MYHARADEGVVTRLEKALTLIKQRKELCNQHKLEKIYEAKLQILTDNGSNRGGACVKVFLPSIPDHKLRNNSEEGEVDPFDGLGSLFG